MLRVLECVKYVALRPRRDGITDEDHPENVLTKWKCLYEDKGRENPHKEQKIYVVPADVHH